MSKLLAIASLLFCWQAMFAQHDVTVEQYSFMGAGQNNLVAPVLHFQNQNKWYGEARYNYEDIHTFSLYGGRTFAVERELSWSLTPIIGAIVGKMNGASFGLNSSWNFHKFNFSSQAQYSLSAASRYNNFFYNWSELCYQPVSWAYTGIALQHTKMYATHNIADPGILIAFSAGAWTVPLYSFNPLGNEKYYVIGINWQWQHPKKASSRPVPLLSAANHPEN